MKVKGNAFKYGDNVDTDVIIPARYLNSSKAEELAAHCMEDIDKNFVKEVKKGDILAANIVPLVGKVGSPFVDGLGRDDFLHVLQPSQLFLYGHFQCLTNCPFDLSRVIGID